MKYIEIDKRGEYWIKHLEEGSYVHTVLFFIYVVPIIGMIVSFFAFLFELIVNFQFDLESIQYLVFFAIIAIVLLMLATSGYNTEK